MLTSPVANQNPSAKLAALLCIIVLSCPFPAWASSFAGLWVVLYGMFIGIPYGLLLLALGIVGIVFMAQKKSLPTFGGFLLIAPPIATAIYVLFPAVASGGRLTRDVGNHLVFCSPIIALTIPVVIFGRVLRRQR